MFNLFQYPPTTTCVYRERYWDDSYSNWAFVWIDLIENMDEFPYLLRKDLIHSHISYYQGLVHIHFVLRQYFLLILRDYNDDQVKGNEILSESSKQFDARPSQLSSYHNRRFCGILPDF